MQSSHFSPNNYLQPQRSSESYSRPSPVKRRQPGSPHIVHLQDEHTSEFFQRVLNVSLTEQIEEQNRPRSQPAPLNNLSITVQPPQAQPLHSQTQNRHFPTPHTQTPYQHHQTQPQHHHTHYHQHHPQPQPPAQPQYHPQHAQPQQQSQYPQYFQIQTQPQSQPHTHAQYPQAQPQQQSQPHTHAQYPQAQPQQQSQPHTHTQYPQAQPQQQSQPHTHTQYPQAQSQQQSQHFPPHQSQSHLPRQHQPPAQPQQQSQFHLPQQQSQHFPPHQSQSHLPRQHQPPAQPQQQFQYHLHRQHQPPAQPQQQSQFHLPQQQPQHFPPHQSQYQPLTQAQYPQAQPQNFPPHQSQYHPQHAQPQQQPQHFSPHAQYQPLTQPQHPQAQTQYQHHLPRQHQPQQQPQPHTHAQYSKAQPQQQSQPQHSPPHQSQSHQSQPLTHTQYPQAQPQQQSQPQHSPPHQSQSHLPRQHQPLVQPQQQSQSQHPQTQTQYQQQNSIVNSHPPRSSHTRAAISNHSPCDPCRAHQSLGAPTSTVPLTATSSTSKIPGVSRNKAQTLKHRQRNADSTGSSSSSIIASKKRVKKTKMPNKTKIKELVDKILNNLNNKEYRKTKELFRGNLRRTVDKKQLIIDTKEINLIIKAFPPQVQSSLRYNNKSTPGPIKNNLRAQIKKIFKIINFGVCKTTDINNLRILIKCYFDIHYKETSHYLRVSRIAHEDQAKYVETRDKLSKDRKLINKLKSASLTTINKLEKILFPLNYASAKKKTANTLYRASLRKKSRS